MPQSRLYRLGRWSVLAAESKRARKSVPVAAMDDVVRSLVQPHGRQSTVLGGNRTG
jgi:hypothetical protein